MYAAAPSAVLVWSMGVTQHATGSENVRAIINLALARGNVGRPGAGLMPIRGHSGVQGGAEMGAYATILPGGEPITPEAAARWSERYGFPVGAERGRSAAEMVEAGGRGELDVLWSVGGNFLETLPDPAAVREALERVPLRVHQDIVLSPQMLVDARRPRSMLPATTRYEQPGGGTETTTERRIVLSPEIAGPRIERGALGVGGADATWLAGSTRSAPGSSASRTRRPSGKRSPTPSRATTASSTFDATGDQVQWGGARLCDGWTFRRPRTAARTSSPVEPVEARSPPGRFRLATRRGKQFNSMVWSRKRPAHWRRSRRAADERRGRRGPGRSPTATRCRVRSGAGEVAARVRVARMRPGNVQMFFPRPTRCWSPAAATPRR